jgi:hypothetical protein
MHRGSSRDLRSPRDALAIRGFALGLALAACFPACSSDVRDPGGTGTSTNASGSIGAGPSRSPGAARGGSGAAPGATCAQGLATTSPITPTVWLVVDGSGSMDERFESSTRWVALRAALMDPGGVVASLQPAVRFGLVLYDGPADGGITSCFAPQNIDPSCLCISGFEPFCCQAGCGGMPAAAPSTPAECANLMVVQPALSNHAALDAAFPAQPLGGSTPTDRALQRVVSEFAMLAPPQPDTRSGPVIVILATDGAPNDTCIGMLNVADLDVEQRVLDVVGDGVQMGLRMFVISLAGDDAGLRSHLQQVAELGSPGQPPFEPSTKDELVDALQNIVGGATCQVALDGTVTVGQECSGEVALNGESLSCNATDGWRLVDDHTFQLTGAACTRFLASPSSVTARFPCGVFIPQ